MIAPTRRRPLPGPYIPATDPTQRGALTAPLLDALADGFPIDRADGSARDLSESEALEAWRAGRALQVRQ